MLHHQFVCGARINILLLWTSELTQPTEHTYQNMCLPQMSKLTDKLHCSCVSIDIHQGPQWGPSVDPTKEHPFLFTVDAKHDVSIPGDVIEENVVDIGKPLGQGFGPVAGFVGQIWAGVAGQLAGVHSCWVMRRESKPNNTTPAGGHRSKLQVDAFIDGHRAVTEADALAKTLDAFCPVTIQRQLDVLTVDLVEQDWPTLQGTGPKVTWTCNKVKAKWHKVKTIWFKSSI